jgi:hypothetical protein
MLSTNTTTCARLLAYVTGLVNQQLLLQNEYLVAENRILKTRLQAGWRLSDGERATLAEIGKRLGRKGLQQVARLAKPDTILAWYRRLVAEKFDGSKLRRSPGRPHTSAEIEDLVVRLARENSGWGYDRIEGALANLRHQVSDQTVGNNLRRRGIAPVPERSKTTTWRDFIRRHMDVLAGTDFFTGPGADLARTGDVLCPIFHSSGQPEDLHRWHHRSSGGVLDASGSLQCHI